MNDLINRKDAIRVVEGVNTANGFHLEKLSSVEPEWRWVPIIKALPKDDARVLTTIETEHRGKQVRSGTYFNGYFNNDNGDSWNATDKEVIAWMPLPEPYRGK